MGDACLVTPLYFGLMWAMFMIWIQVKRIADRLDKNAEEAEEHAPD